MCSTNNWERKGGASIIPSARKSIHAPRSGPSECSVVMGHFGINSQGINSVQRKETSTRQQENGTDEVDNVMSKLASSPQLNRNTPRRISLGSPNKSQIDSSGDNNVVAQSLPAKLPSHSYYREDIDDYLQEYEKRSPNRSRGTPTPRYVPESYGPNIHDSLNSTRDSSFESATFNTQPNHAESSFQASHKLLFVVVIIVAILIFNMNLFSTNDVVKQSKYDLYRFHSDMKGLGERYKIDGDSILQVQTGISTIYEREDTGSFVFTYNSDSSSFSQMVFNEFMDDIASTAARYLRNDTASVQHIVVDSSDLTMESHSELVTHYRADVAKTGVMLVRDVNRLPSPLAMAFHYYCDEYNPLVKKSAIFFTLNLAKCSQKDLKATKATHAHIEKCLTSKWNGVPEDNIQPLLTRVVSVVIDVTSAFK